MYLAGGVRFISTVIASKAHAILQDSFTLVGPILLLRPLLAGVLLVLGGYALVDNSSTIWRATLSLADERGGGWPGLNPFMRACLLWACMLCATWG